MKIRPRSFRNEYTDVSIPFISHSMITSFTSVGFALDEFPADIRESMISLCISVLLPLVFLTQDGLIVIFLLWQNTHKKLTISNI